MSKTPSKARVRFPDADGNGEWQEVEVRDFNAFVEAFIMERTAAPITMTNMMMANTLMEKTPFGADCRPRATRIPLSDISHSTFARLRRQAFRPRV